MTIYLSGAITHEPKAKELFAKAKSEVLSLYPDADVINPMQLPHQHDKSWKAFMKEDIAAMMKCDAIYMLENWMLSKGAKIERKLALDLEMKVIYQMH